MINQTDVVSKFASLIGTKRTSKEPPVATASLVKADPKEATSRELLMCISKTVAFDQVVCTLPSLDMRKLDEDPDANLLPKVGEHFPMKMEASVLHNAAEASDKAAQVEQKAVQTLGKLTSWTRSSVVYASKSISENAANSFASLVESRVRAWTLLLLRHSLTGDASSRSRLLSMLESIIKVNSAQIAFKPLKSVVNTEKTENDPDVILPLIAELDLNITVHNKNCTVTLRAPGTISAYFDRTDDNDIGMGLTSVAIGLKTEILLESMVKEARMVVFNAVAKATSGSKMDPNLMRNSEEGIKPKPKSQLSSGFSSRSQMSSGFSSRSQLSSGFSSSLRQSASVATFASSGLKLPGRKGGPNVPAHRSMKAHSSSLKLNKVLSSATMQNSRSVQFNNLNMKAKPDDVPKRQKLATTARLTSFKSFGRPHAGDFGSDGGPKNATFANFGGTGACWGRDGKLASKPSPMLPTETADMLTSQTRRNMNATFEVKKPPIHLSNRSSGLGIRTKKGLTRATSRDMFNQVPSSIPRTATAAESLLLARMRDHKI